MLAIIMGNSEIERKGLERLWLDYKNTRELPGVALVNISNGSIFTGKGNTHLKWNIEVAHVDEKIFEWGTIFCEIAS